MRELIAAAVGEFGGLDGLFNVGADMRALRGDTDVVDIDLAVWDRLLTVNLRGYLLTMRHAIPHLLERGGGAIVNTSSAAAFQGEPARPAYAAAKAGIGALTRHVATRWGREGIRCNAVAPGFTATEAIRAAERWPELEAGALHAQPAGRRERRRGRAGHLPALRRRRLDQRPGAEHRWRHRPALSRAQAMLPTSVMAASNSCASG